MANGTLSNYFEQDRVKAAKKAGGDSVYSAPAEPAGGGSTGGPSAPSAPKGSAGGGTGFVSFGQYFGANAPAIQQQAQKQAVSAKGFEELNALQKPGGMEGSAFDQLLGGGVTQREAEKQGQYRFQQLGARLNEGVDTTMGGKTIDAAQAKQAEQNKLAQEQAASAQQQQDLARRVYSASGQQGEWDKLPDWQKNQYLAQAASLMDAEKKKNEILASGNLG